MALYARPRQGENWESLQLSTIEGEALAWGASLPIKTEIANWVQIVGFDGERTGRYVLTDDGGESLFTAQSIDLVFTDTLPQPTTTEWKTMAKHAGDRDNTRDLDISRDWALMEALNEIEELNSKLRGQMDMVSKIQHNVLWMADGGHKWGVSPITLFNSRDWVEQDFIDFDSSAPSDRQKMATAITAEYDAIRSNAIHR